MCPIKYSLVYVLTMKETTVTTIRLPRDVLHLLSQVTENRGENMSVFIRRLIYRELASMSYLDDATKKALGIKLEAEQ